VREYSTKYQRISKRELRQFAALGRACQGDAVFLQARARLRLSMRGRARCRPSNGVRWTGKAQEGTLKSDKRGTPGRMYGASSVSAMKPYSHVCKTITRSQSLASCGVEFVQSISAGCPRDVGGGLTTCHC